MKKSKKVSNVSTIVSRRLRARLARWWNELNCWTIPADFPKHYGFATEEERREFIRGAFTVVDKLAGRSGLALWRKENVRRRNGG